ncbi:ABC transporter ATP-binding protein [Sporomusa aerivorans]|uniref:ABC transporter ATP-binding protein n=1 Tax=Sporomusa aerivorans TaxID=204936 RepID=UPI00352B7240
MHLSVQKIKVTLGNKDIIREISLESGKGEFIGLIGPNGCGKSTLLRTIYRVIKPNTGAILFDGKDLKDIRLSDSAKKVGVVGQFNHLDFDLTVLELVLMGRSPHKSLLAADTAEDYELALSAIRKVGMENYTDRNFTTLSGGEKQRILLARALAQQPRLLILDEPTNHLDIKYQLQLLSIVKSLGIGVLAALHDLSLAAMYCDKLYVMKDGKIVACGQPNKIITPELIHEVYEIDCAIQKNAATGCLSISYYPACRYA